LARDTSFDDIQTLLAAIVDSSEDAILAKDLDGIIQSCNRSTERIFGYTAAELVGQHVAILIPPELQDEEMEILRRLRRGERIEHFETVRMTKDGRRLDISLTISPIRDSSGRIIGASKIARDITEQKRTAAQLAEQREWLRVTLSSIGDAVVTSDPDGRITFMNEVAAHLTGWTAAEATGRPLAEIFRIINEDTREAVAAPSDKVIESGHVVGLANHTVLLARDGREWPIEDSAAPILDAQKRILGVVLVFHDITERRRAERDLVRRHASERAARAEAERASRLKDDFVAMVSHELRTPLNAIVGWSQMLRTAKLDEATTQRAIDAIGRNAQAQSALVSDLLDISRIVSGKLSLESQRVDLAAIVNEAVDAMQPSAVEKGVSLTVSFDVPAAETLGDPARLQQVLLNLLTNAIKFTPGGGRIDVRLRRDADRAVLTVRDTGKGIGADFLPHVFDRFRQADASTTRRHGGLGLGLAIVRHIVELHQGRVGVESDGPGRGATFAVSLPLAPMVTAAPSTRKGEHIPICAPDLLSGYRVMIVDDEPDTLELMAYSLGRCGAEVTAAASVSEALDLFPRARPDIVISDIGMPDQNGYDLMRALRGLPAEAGGRVPAIAVTAFVGHEEREAALAAGFQEHVAKPVQPTRLARIVADLLKRQPTGRA